MFGPDLNQEEIYQQIGGALLKNFLEGFNVTVLCYGNSGCGKSHTLGTNEDLSVSSVGIVQRFVVDLFRNVANFSNELKQSAKIRFSCLEVNGENVYDLNPTADDASSISLDKRQSLEVRDVDGSAYVQGLTQIEVATPDAANKLVKVANKNRLAAPVPNNKQSSR